MTQCYSLTGVRLARVVDDLSKRGPKVAALTSTQKSEARKLARIGYSVSDIRQILNLDICAKTLTKRLKECRIHCDGMRS